jgi:hypothetical protein
VRDEAVGGDDAQIGQEVEGVRLHALVGEDPRDPGGEGRGRGSSS